jgi:preprotein translocase subunit YajC
MTILTSLIAATSTTAAPSKSSGSSPFSYVILLAIVAAFYFLIIRPRQARQRQARTQAATLEVGATVMSVGGIKGTVVDMDDTDVRVEVAPGVVLTFVRRAVNAQAAPPAAVVDDDGFPARDEDRSTGDVARDEPEDRPGTGTEGP